MGLQKAFSSQYVIQDDARAYVIWMQRFIDANLLPNDLIADYFQSITPTGYALLYKSLAILGINPLFTSKILPLFLGLITTIYCFLFCRQILTKPSTAFMATLLLNQSLWFKTDLVSATPRSFIYPLMLAFFYYLNRQSWFAVTLIIILESLFYPLAVFISAGILCLKLWRKYILLLSILCIGFLAMLPYIISSSEYAPVVTASQAWNMPEHWVEGRHPFFNQNPWVFWLIGQHSGILPPLMPPLIWFFLLFPWMRQKSSKWRFIQSINRENINLFWQIAIVSLSLYFAAHIIFLKLFFPTRYILHTARILFSVLSAIVLTNIFDKAINISKNNRKFGFINQRIGLRILASILLIILLFYPNFLKTYPKTDYRVGRQANLYEFIQKQPKETLIATLAEEGDNLPIFAQRSVLIAKEYALPFHLDYYSKIRQRSLDLIQAQYTDNVAIIQQFIKKYDVDFWLLEKGTFEVEYLISKTWLKSFQPQFNQALTNLRQTKELPLSQLMQSCHVYQDNHWTLVSGKCLIQQTDSK
ncbi:hypothetical protein [Calothrix sp. PCC 6303]|uniref:hypothetical protein n=1 Tax=Calothrix sp. PCC 6303 TaxID=1170562 RepID=UPI001181A39D|nr:hypothetical protein [Calothrix sp. PCC 6303]